MISYDIKQLEKKDNNKQRKIENNRITLKIHFQLQVIDILAEKDSTLKELMIAVINQFSLYKSIDKYGCFSQQKKQILRLDDTFDYTKSDTLFIFEKRLELMVQLDIEGVQENITFSLLESDTIKDIKRQLNDYLKQKKRPELKNIEIYKDSILQNDETITIFQLFKQPYIQVKSISKNHENKNPIKYQIPEKQQIEMQQNDFNIQSEIQLLKELFDTKLKNLELLFIQMLKDSRNNIVKELEFFERDMTQIQQLLMKSFNQQQLSQLIKSKQTLYNQQKQISQEHIQKLQSEFEKIQFNIQKEQQELQEKQRNCFDMVKIEIQKSIKSFYVDEQKVLQELTAEVDDKTTFEELIEYLEYEFPDIFKKYTKVFGPLRQWVGFSKNKVVKLQENLNNHLNEFIKFGPIHIDIKSKLQQSRAIDTNIKIFELQNK